MRHIPIGTFLGTIMLRLILISTLLSCLSAHAFHSTEVPPLVDVPVWSMATLNEDGSTNFNILTYATPVSIRPNRLWTLGLFKQTKSYERKCILQLLTADHIPLVRLLGGRSGNDIDKEEECAKVFPNLSLQNIDNDDLSIPKVLPSGYQQLVTLSMVEIPMTSRYARLTKC